MKGHATKVIVPERASRVSPDPALDLRHGPAPLQGFTSAAMVSLIFIAGVTLLLATPGPTNAPPGDGRRIRRLARGRQALLLASWPPIRQRFSQRACCSTALRRGPAIRTLVQAAAALYLVLLAVRLWRQGRSGVAEGLIGPRQIAATTLLNPKGLIIALGLMPEAAWGQTDLLLAHSRFLAVLTPLFGGLWLSAGAMGAMAAGNAGAAPPAARCGDRAMPLRGTARSRRLGRLNGPGTPACEVASLP